MKDSQDAMLKDFLSSFIFLFAGRVSGLCFGLLSASLLARGLGPEGRGTLALAMLLPASIQSIAGMSINAGIVHYAAKDKSKENLRQIFGAACILNGMLTMGQFLLTILVAKFFGRWLVTGVHIEFVYLAAVLGSVGALFACQADSMLSGVQAFRYLGYFAAWTAPLLPLCYLALYLTHQFTVPSVLWTNFAVLLFFSMLNVRKVITLCGLPSFKKFRMRGKKILAFGIACHASNVITFFNYRIDMFILNSYHGKVATGFYGSAVSIAERLWMVSQVCGQIIFPKISGMTIETDRRRLTRRVALIILIATGLASIVLWVIAPYIVNLLFGPEFAPSASGIRWLLPGICALSVGRIFTNDLSGRGKPKYNAYFSAITLAANISLNVALIPSMGIRGAALATSVSYSATAILAYMAFQYECGRSNGLIKKPSSVEIG